MHAIDQLEVTRRLFVKLGDGMGDEITRVPEGYSNHALWNLGHVAVTLRLLVYRLSGLEVGLDPQLVADFSKGSAPLKWERTYAWDDVRGLLLEQPAQVRADLEGGRFTDFQRYETSAGVVLESVEQAIAFNSFHEGIHLGYVLAQRRRLG